MQANELMVGDWVDYKGIRNRVARADLDIHHEKWIAEITPIPLTPEILEKNGFERSEVFVEWKYESDDVYMIYKPFPYLKIQTEECIVAFPCEYVHELQHALRLCGIEKEIIL